MAGHDVLGTLRADLRAAFDAAKCRKCGCLRDTLIALREEIADVPGEEADAVRADIAKFLAGMEEAQYTCLGCDPCLPAVAENRFHAAAEGVWPLHQARRPSCAFEVRTGGDWPVVAGEYLVLDPQGSVAVTTLASTELPQRLAESRPHGLAIVGKTETENIGIDKVVKNVVSNPCIRTLIVAGQDPKGHLSGQTLLALAANGLDDTQRVIGSPGKRPVLRNVTLDEVAQLRQQVEVVDLVGCGDAQGISEEVERRARTRSCECQAPTRAAAPSAAVIRAERPQRVKPAHGQAGARPGMDKAGYFVILPQADRGVIVCEHYTYDNVLRHVLEGEDARSLCAKVLELGLVRQLDHAAYLGRELAKAELSLRLGFRYVQDGA